MRLASLPFHKVRSIIVTLGELNYAEPRTDILTAIGTLGAVIVAVGSRCGPSTGQAAGSGKSGSAATGSSPSSASGRRAAVEDERAHGRAQLEEERRITLEREQLA